MNRRQQKLMTLKDWHPWLVAAAFVLSIASTGFLTYQLRGLVHDRTEMMRADAELKRVSVLSPSDSVTWRWNVAADELVQKEYHPHLGAGGTMESDREFAERVIVNVKDWKDLTRASTR